MKSLKAKIVLTACSIGFIATLIGLAVSSYAWFSANRNAKAAGMSLTTEIDTNLVSLDFKLYKYDFDKKEGVEYIEGREGFNLQLNDFDNFIRERNVNNNNIIRFKIKRCKTRSIGNIGVIAKRKKLNMARGVLAATEFLADISDLKL